MKQKVRIIIAVTRQNRVMVVKNKKHNLSSLVYCSLGKNQQPKEAAQAFLSRCCGLSNLEPKLIGVLNTKVSDETLNYIDLIYNVEIANQNLKPLDFDYYWQNLGQPIDGMSLDEPSKNALRVLSGQELSSSTTPPNAPRVDFVIYTDGASRGNPGHSAAGYIIYNHKNEPVISSGEYLGITTSTVAEYYAIKIALEAVLEMGAKVVECRIDNSSVVNQLKSVYAVKNRDVWPIHESIISLMKQFDSVKFTHINREYNNEADQIANDILDQYVNKY